MELSKPLLIIGIMVIHINIVSIEPNGLFSELHAFKENPLDRRIVKDWLVIGEMDNCQSFVKIYFVFQLNDQNGYSGRPRSL